MRRRVLEYLEAQKDASDLEDDGKWELIKPDLSFRIWRFWKAYDFNLDLWDGGVLNWPEWFIHDATLLNWLYKLLKQQTPK